MSRRGCGSASGTRGPGQRGGWQVGRSRREWLAPKAIVSPAEKDPRHPVAPGGGRAPENKHRCESPLLGATCFLPKSASSRRLAFNGPPHGLQAQTFFLLVVLEGGPCPQASPPLHLGPRSHGEPLQGPAAGLFPWRRLSEGLCACVRARTSRFSTSRIRINGLIDKPPL